MKSSRQGSRIDIVSGLQRYPNNAFPFIYLHTQNRHGTTLKRGWSLQDRLSTISPNGTGIGLLWSCNKAVANVFPYAEPSCATRTGQYLLDS